MITAHLPRSGAPIVARSLPPRVPDVADAGPRRRGDRHAAAPVDLEVLAGVAHRGEIGDHVVGVLADHVARVADVDVAAVAAVLQPAVAQAVVAAPRLFA